MSNTPQGGAIESNAADDTLMADQGCLKEPQLSDGSVKNHMKE